MGGPEHAKLCAYHPISRCSCQFCRWAYQPYPEAGIFRCSADVTDLIPGNKSVLAVALFI